MHRAPMEIIHFNTFISTNRMNIQNVYALLSERLTLHLSVLRQYRKRVVVMLKDADMQSGYDRRFMRCEFFDLMY